MLFIVDILEVNENNKTEREKECAQIPKYSSGENLQI